MDTNTWIWIIVAAVVALIVGIVIGNPIGAKRQKKKDKETIGTAEDKAKTIVNDALKLAETKKKEAILEAKEEIHKNRNEAEREIRERRNEVQKMEKRIIESQMSCLPYKNKTLWTKEPKAWNIKKIFSREKSRRRKIDSTKSTKKKTPNARCSKESAE